MMKTHPADQSMDWRHLFQTAMALPASASRHEKADRGRLFEKMLAEMFLEAGLEPRFSYRPKGEEIDGSFWMHGRTILVEAKWTESPHPASSLYQFRGKVDGKLTGTIGLFVSIAGFSPDAVDALIAGKELNLILMDGDDIRQIADGNVSVLVALERKLRAAGESGTPFLPLSAPETSRKKKEEISSVVFVEGRFDATVLKLIQQQMQGAGGVSIIPAGGPLNMPQLLGPFMHAASVGQITLVIDGDMSTNATLQDKLAEALRDAPSEDHVKVVYLHPDLEVALGLADSAEVPWRERAIRRVRSEDELTELICKANIKDRARTNQDIADLLRAIGVSS